MAKTRTGTIRERKPGVWNLAVAIAKMQRVEDGILKMDRLARRIEERRERRYETFHGTEAEAQARLKAIQAEAEAGEAPASGTIVAMLADWQRTKRHKWKESTAVRYETTGSKHIVPFIGTRPMAGFSKADAKAFFATLRENGRTENTVKTVPQGLDAGLRLRCRDG